MSRPKTKRSKKTTTILTADVALMAALGHVKPEVVKKRYRQLARKVTK